MRTKLIGKDTFRLIFVLLLAIAPVMAVGALNVREISLKAQLRSTVFIILITIGLWKFSNLIIKDRERAAIYSSVFIFMFFSYGHFLYQINTKQSLYIHWFLWIGLGLIPVVIQWSAKKSESIKNFFITALNILGIVMIAQSAYKMVEYPLAISRAPNVNEIEFSGYPDQPSELPDVYYIILDAYTRADTLQMIGFDNSKFIEELKKRDFFVAQCSTSNYKFTTLSLSSGLNMDYMWNILPHENENDPDNIPIDKSIKQNRVRDIFSSMGYQVVAFQTGYLWTEWHEANIYFEPDYNIFLAPDIQPFERLLIYMSAVRPVLENGWLNIDLGDIFSYQAHITRIHYTFDILKTLPEITGPKFVFAHVLLPHPPYIFKPDGTLNKNSAYFNQTNSLSTNDRLNQIGYINNIQFTNSQILPVIDVILANSATPPIIIIQGDHGSWNSNDDSKFTILNAYYFPEKNETNLYPRITPVNSFRILFNEYFGAKYPLLEDLTILTDIGRPYKTRQTPKIPSPCD